MKEEKDKKLDKAESAEIEMKAQCAAKAEDSESSAHTSADAVPGAKKRTARFFAAVGVTFAAFGKTMRRWLRRMFMGAEKEMSEIRKFGVEEIVSPGKQVVKNFFRKPLAVIALSIVTAMFLFVFIGPMFSTLDLSYEENYHANLPPGYSYMKVPKKLSGNVKSISSYSFFSVGVDHDGELYVGAVRKCLRPPTRPMYPFFRTN